MKLLYLVAALLFASWVGYLMLLAAIGYVVVGLLCLVTGHVWAFGVSYWVYLAIVAVIAILWGIFNA